MYPESPPQSTRASADILGIVRSRGGSGLDDIVWSTTRRIVASADAEAGCGKYDRNNPKRTQQ